MANENFFYYMPLAAANVNSHLEDNETKIPHDSYDVYVNGDYVGKKTLLEQNEDISDLAKYLKNKGYFQVAEKLDGDHYYITTDKDQEIKELLGVYLNIR